MTIKDLTVIREPKQFRLGDHVYTAAPAMPAGLLRKFTQAAKESEEVQLDRFMEILDAVMLPESAERFAARMNDPADPITIDDLRNVLEWLMEEYTGRPTVPPSTSASPQSESGTTSTDGLPPPASIPTGSPLTATST